MYFPLGPLAPDRPARLNDETLQTADGVYAIPDGYRPVGQFAGTYGALPTEPKGAAAFVAPDGSSSIIAGTETNLYRAAPGTWTSIASGYSVVGGARWRFAQFGGLAIATNSTSAMVKIDLASFAVSTLAGSPPTFESLAVVKDFLVGTCLDGNVNQMGWSGANDAEYWTFGQKQSDYQILPDGGRINGILSGEFGIILQRDCIRRMDYVAGNAIFEFNVVSTNIGCVTVHSVAQWGILGFFLSDEGFMMWTGSEVVPIGNEIIDRTFGSLYDGGDWDSMSAAVDPVNRVVMWSMGDKIYCYNWILQKWTTITYAAPIIFSGVTEGLGIDDQDPTFGATDDDLDASGLPSLDDPSFKGGDPKSYVFSDTFTMGSFSGTPMAAAFATNDIAFAEGNVAHFTFVEPDIDATTGVSVSFAAKQRLADTPIVSAANTIMPSGHIPCRVSGKYIRTTWNIAAGTPWTYFKGFSPSIGTSRAVAVGGRR